MILTIAVFIGLIAGITRATVGKRVPNPPSLRALWLVPAAYLPQALVFSIPATRERIPDEAVPFIQIGSMAVLLAFSAVNWRKAGFWALGLGLLLNFLVITSNGGWMPISPETLQERSPNAPPGSWQTGERLGLGKDMVLASSDTRLAWLSDRFVTPDYFPYHVAFSLGDGFIAAGAFLLLWSMGAPPKPHHDPNSYGGNNGNRITTEQTLGKH